jgi:hypothetical protein
MHCYDDAPPRDNPKESVDEPVNGVAAVHWCLRVWTTESLALYELNFIWENTKVSTHHKTSTVKGLGRLHSISVSSS